MDTILAGLDAGTTGVRCMLFSTDGREISRAYREYSSSYPLPGWVEQNPQEILQSSFAVCREAIAKSGVCPESIKAVGFSVQRSVCCLIDKFGQPLGNFISWQDNRCVEQAQELARGISPEEYYRVSGLPIGATWVGAKILWLRENQPQRFAQAARIVQLGDYLLRCFGADDFYTDMSSSVFYGLWDVQKGNWNQSRLDELELDKSILGVPTPSATRLGTISPQIAEKTGFAVGTAICLAAGDQNCSTVGMGGITPGAATVTLGTCGLAVLTVDTPVAGFGGMMITNHPVRGLWGIEGITNAAACSYSWLRNQIGTGTADNSFEQLNRLAAESAPGANGVVFTPYLAGSASPNWNLNARGAFNGISLSTSRADLIRAAGEGIIYEIKSIIDAWNQAGYSTASVRVGGGFAQSAFWNQIQADIYGVPVQTLRCSESACLGAAAMAGSGVNVFSSIVQACQAMVRTEEQLLPCKNNASVYQERLGQFNCFFRRVYSC